MYPAEIVDYLAAHDYGIIGTNLFEGYRPDTPDALTVVYAYPGPPATWTHQDSRPESESPRLQVLIRGADEAAARALETAICRTLEAIVNQTLGSDRYLAIRSLQSAPLARRDERERTLLSRNYQVTLIPAE